MKNWFHNRLQCFWNFLYNDDRAIASLGGAPPQDTISGEIGKHQGNPLVKPEAKILDAIQKNHVENAEAHDDALDAADAAYYAKGGLGK